MTHPLDPGSPDYLAMQDAGRAPSHHDPTEWPDTDALLRAARDYCHPDCGPLIIRADREHAHNNVDGVCWHDDGLLSDFGAREAAEDRFDDEAKRREVYPVGTAYAERIAAALDAADDDAWAAYDGMGPLEAWDADGNR